MKKNTENDNYKGHFWKDFFENKKINISLIIVISLSIIFVILESVPSYSKKHSQFFYVTEWIFTIIFLIEYLLRIFTSKKPLKYMLSLTGMIDFLQYYLCFWVCL